jgi:hypothetical protein
MNKQAIIKMAVLATLYLGVSALQAADDKVAWLDEMNLSHLPAKTKPWLEVQFMTEGDPMIVRP